MFAPFMQDTWITASIVAVIAALVGFFVVLRGAAFTAHAVPNAAFAGAAGAGFIGINTLYGLGVFSLGGALLIGLLSRRGRHDAVTALTVAMMLGLGALFLSWSTEYAPEIYSLLFGEVLGLSPNEVGLTAILALVCFANRPRAPLPAAAAQQRLDDDDDDDDCPEGRRGPRDPAVAHGTRLPRPRHARHDHRSAGRRRATDVQPDGRPARRGPRPDQAPPAPAMALSVLLALVTVWGAIRA